MIDSGFRTPCHQTCPTLLLIVIRMSAWASVPPKFRVSAELVTNGSAPSAEFPVPPMVTHPTHPDVPQALNTTLNLILISLFCWCVLALPACFGTRPTVRYVSCESFGAATHTLSRCLYRTSIESYFYGLLGRKHDRALVSSPCGGERCENGIEQTATIDDSVQHRA